MNIATPLKYTEHVTFDSAYKYGKYFYIATLKDGRDVAFSADKVLVTDTGDLLAVSSTFYNENTEQREDIESKTILCLAKGEWLSFYAASALTGDPVGIEWVEPVKS